MKIHLCIISDTIGCVSGFGNTIRRLSKAEHERYKNEDIYITIGKNLKERKIEINSNPPKKVRKSCTKWS